MLHIPFILHILYNYFYMNKSIPAINKKNTKRIQALFPMATKQMRYCVRNIPLLLYLRDTDIIIICCICKVQ